MPQVYWLGSNYPEYQVRESYRQLTAMANLPFIPAGAAYHENGYTVTADQISRFNKVVLDMGLPGHLYWEMNYLFERPDWYEAVRGTPVAPIENNDTHVQVSGKGFVSSAIGLNVRSEPKVVPGNRVGVLSYGDTVSFSEKQTMTNGDEWIKIVYKNAVAWACSLYQGTKLITLRG
jgi:hypothetical protein